MRLNWGNAGLIKMQMAESLRMKSERYLSLCFLSLQFSL